MTSAADFPLDFSSVDSVKSSCVHKAEMFTNQNPTQWNKTHRLHLHHKKPWIPEWTNEHFVFIFLQDFIKQSHRFTPEQQRTVQAAAQPGAHPNSAVPHSRGCHEDHHPGCSWSQENLPEDVFRHALELLLHWNFPWCPKVSTRSGQRYDPVLFTKPWFETETGFIFKHRSLNEEHFCPFFL